MIKIKAETTPTTPLKSSPTRGEIQGFSKKSRKRMIEKLADEEEVPDLFITLTYSDDCVSTVWENYRKNFEAIRRRLERNYGEIKAVWRLEAEKRKSGGYVGEFVPHFHIIVWLPSEHKDKVNMIVDKKDGHKINEWWHEITGSKSEVHKNYRGCHISRVKSRRHSYHYVSKYVAKSSDENLNIGRRWGTIGTVGQGSRADIIMNKQVYIELKRLIVSYQKKRNKNLSRLFNKMSVSKGLTVFGMSVNDTKSNKVADTFMMRLYKHAVEIAVSKGKFDFLSVREYRH